MSAIRFILAGIVKVFLSIVIVTTGVFFALRALEDQDLASDIAGNIERSIIEGMATEAATLEIESDKQLVTTISNDGRQSGVFNVPAQSVSGFVDAQSILNALIAMQTQTQKMQQLSHDRLLEQLAFELNRSHVLESTLQMRAFRDSKLTQDLERLGQDLAAAAVPAVQISSGMAALLNELDLALSESGISVETDISAGILRIGEDSLSFARGRSDVSAAARDVLLQITATLSAVLPRYTPCRLGVELALVADTQAPQ